MSGQYLEAHAFLKTLRDKGVPYTETLVNLMQYAVIEEVAPVVHAHWIELYDPISYVSIGYEYVPKTIINCSNCNNEVEVKTPYCPNCGAKMDGKEGKE